MPRVFFSGFEHLRKDREHLNRINVFPVPDGDTGNNMVSTLLQVAQDLRPSRSVHATFRTMADAAISGARGNSGMIVAQYAYRAIENPAEGTIITVLRH